MAIDAHALVTIIIDGAPWWPEVCPCHRAFARMRGGFLFAVTPGFSGGKRILRCCCTLRPAYAAPLYAWQWGFPRRLMEHNAQTATAASLIAVLASMSTPIACRMICSLRGRGSVASTLSVDVAGRHHYHEGK